MDEKNKCEVKQLTNRFQTLKSIELEQLNYQDAHHHLRVSIPQIEAEGEESLEGVLEINTEILQQIVQLLITFREEASQIKEGYLGLDVGYEVILNSEDWFTLRLSILETKASGYQRYLYYHLDKRTGEQIQLSDLFLKDSDYQKILSENIKQQMREQSKKDESIQYFLNEKEYPQFNFEQIKPNQNFYWNEAGELVIVFDEYEVAPGVMGTPEFVIPKEVIEPLLKECFKKI